MSSSHWLPFFQNRRWEIIYHNNILKIIMSSHIKSEFQSPTTLLRFVEILTERDTSSRDIVSEKMPIFFRMLNFRANENSSMHLNRITPTRIDYESRWLWKLYHIAYIKKLLINFCRQFLRISRLQTELTRKLGIVYKIRIRAYKLISLKKLAINKIQK